MTTNTQAASVQHPLQTALKLFLLAAILAALLLSGLKPTHAGEGAAAILPTNTAFADAIEPYLFKDLLSGSEGSSPSQLSVANDLLFFRADSWLWKSDGTPDGTIVYDHSDLWPFYNPKLMGEVNGSLLLYANDYYSSYYGLWKTDGSDTGTAQIEDFFLQYTHSDNMRGFHIFNGILYFFMLEDSWNYLQMWTSDNTVEGTNMVVRIPVNCSLPRVDMFANLNNQLHFLIQSGSDCHQLWKTDGTDTGTVLVKSFQEYSEGMVLFDERLFISADDDDGSGWELWVSDGTSAGTTLFKDLYPGSEDSMPHFVGIVGDTLYLGAEDPTIGHELWVSDGTPEGTQVFKDLYPGSNGSYPSRVAVLGTDLIFSAIDSTYFRKLWRSDGTVAGTLMIGEDYPIESMSFQQIDNTLYFSGGDFDHGYEFWQSDGSADGTFMIADINPGTASSDPGYFTQYDGKIFFQADDGSHGDELWAIDLPQDVYMLYLPVVIKSP